MQQRTRSGELDGETDVLELKVDGKHRLSLANLHLGIRIGRHGDTSHLLRARRCEAIAWADAVVLRLLSPSWDSRGDFAHFSTPRAV